MATRQYFVPSATARYFRDYEAPSPRGANTPMIAVKLEPNGRLGYTVDPVKRNDEGKAILQSTCQRWPPACWVTVPARSLATPLPRLPAW